MRRDCCRIVVMSPNHPPVTNLFFGVPRLQLHDTEQRHLPKSNRRDGVQPQRVLCEPALLLLLLLFGKLAFVCLALGLAAQSIHIVGDKICFFVCVVGEPFPPECARASGRKDMPGGLLNRNECLQRW